MSPAACYVARWLLRRQVAITSSDLVNYAAPSDYLGYDLNVKRCPPYNRPMRIPERIPGLKLLTFLLALYAVVWIALEGNLVRVLLLALGITVTGLGHGIQRLGAGRTLSRPEWLLLGGLFGLLLGSGSALLALLLMALKTGLHAHGPEFSQAQINWVLGQFPWWAAGGLLAGLGLALLTLAFYRGEREG